MHRLCIADDFVISVRRDAVYDYIEQRKHKEADKGCADKEQVIVEIKEQEQLFNDREGEGQVQSGSNERQEEYRQKLGIDTPPDVLLCHADVLHDLKAGLVLVPL